MSAYAPCSRLHAPNILSLYTKNMTMTRIPCEERLTPLDLLMPRTYISAVLTFRTMESTIAISESLQEKLDALVHHIPWLSGRVLPTAQAPGEKPGLMVRWDTDSTVPQVINKDSIEATYEELAEKGMPPDAIPAHVWPVPAMIDNTLFEAGAPVLAASVFRFSDEKAIGLCISMHHNVVDATGFTEIIKLWAKQPFPVASASPRFSSLPTDHHDNRSHKLSNALSPALESISTSNLLDFHPEFSSNPPAIPPSFTFPPSASKMFTIPMSRINAIKNALGTTTSTTITTNTIVSALLWTAITRARAAASSSTPNENTRLTTAVNGRAQVFPPSVSSQDPYLGNAVLYATTKLPFSSILPDGTDAAVIADPPEAIYSAIAASQSRIDARHVAEVHSMVESSDDYRAIFPGWDLFGSRDVTITSWANLAFYGDGGVDFGFGGSDGTPDFVRVPGVSGEGAMADGVVVVLPIDRRMMPGGKEGDVDGERRRGVEVLVMLWEGVMEELVKGAKDLGVLVM